MGTIQSSIGLITVIPIQDTVDQLMAISARPRDLLISRANANVSEQIGVTELTAKVLGVQFAADNLGKVEVFDQKKVSSSNNAALSATITGEPALGVHQFTPIRTAQTHQLISGGVSSLDDPLGGGSFSLRFGGFVDEGIDLDQLNGGSGVQRGKIRITDRSGISAIVDLRNVQTVDDVIATINQVDEINVKAVASGDSFKIIDNTGQSSANLRIQEIGTGSTAADLGLAGIDVAANEAIGADVLRLAESTRLTDLNGGAGVALDKGIPDIEVNFQDGGSSLFIDFNRAATFDTNSVATTAAGPGVDAQLVVAALTPGSSYDDVTVQYVADAGVTAGSETVVYDESDPQDKTLTVHVEAGVTTAADVFDAINNDITVGALFSASLPGDGSGLVNINEQAVTAGVANQSAAITTALNGANAEVTFTAVDTGTDFDGVTVLLVDNGGITQGNETVVYDDSDPQNKTLTFQIDAGSTTSADIAAALTGDATASLIFTAVAGGDGLGLVDVTDTAVTNGGEPTATAVVGSATGNNSSLTIRSVGIGSDFDDVTIQFAHSASVTQGNETVAYSSINKTLTFQISEGETTADDILAALAGNSSANAVFTAELFVGGSGDGLIRSSPTYSTSGGAAQEASEDKTLGEIVATINAVDPTRLHAELVDDRIVLTDLSTPGSGTFEVSSFLGTGVAEDLGIAGVATGDTLTGGRVLGGLKTSLLSRAC